MNYPFNGTLWNESMDGEKRATEKEGGEERERGGRGGGYKVGLELIKS